jgi:Mg2+ and Co2+ transporter CorA
MNKYIYILFLYCIIFTGCKKGEKKEIEVKPNDEFRNEILSGLEIQKDTAQIFYALLDRLDSKGITYGTFYKKRFYEIEDSCYNANKNFLDSLNKVNTYLYCNYIDSIRNKATKEYQYYLSISDDELYAVLFVTTINPSINQYLNQNYDLNLFIPEE